MRRLIVEVLLDDLETGSRQEAAAVLRNIASEVIDSPSSWLYLPHAYFHNRQKLASIKLDDPAAMSVINLHRVGE